jgi:hypothetical protein
MALATSSGLSYDPAARWPRGSTQLVKTLFLLRCCIFCVSNDSLTTLLEKHE